MGDKTLSFQILNVLIYSFNGEIRSIDFEPGKLNIITGASKTGKSSLIDIIDYCFGNDECNIADGVIPSNVDWVGVRLQIAEGQLFIARKMPVIGKNSSYDIYYEVKKEISIPKHSKLKKLISLDYLKDILSNYVGIGENIHIPPEGQTRDKLIATIRHTLSFTFQKQDEISNRNYLFHNQSNHWAAQAIKDTFPYFLGSVVYDYIDKLNEIKSLKRKLNSKKKKLADIQSIVSTGTNLSRNLLLEAKEYGLYDEEIPEDLDTTIQKLETIEAKIETLDFDKDLMMNEGVLQNLIDEKLSLIKQHDEIHDKLNTYKLLYRDKKEFSDELNDHLLRLRPIHIFDENSSTDKCPLCNSIISESELPSIKNMKGNLKLLEDQMRIVEEKTPQMDRAIQDLNLQLEIIKSEIQAKNESIKEIYRTNDKLKKIRNKTVHKSYLVGKIGLYIESLSKKQDNRSLENEISLLEQKIEILESDVSQESIYNNTERIISILSKYMNEFATELNLEYSKYPLRLDIKKLTVLVDKDDVTTTMDKMGSAENWLGSHIIALFALHRWFVNKTRPIPRFLFLDQPSQVYFPSEKDFVDGNARENEDFKAVKRIYKLAYDLANELSPNFQIIITDHADIDEAWFEDCVIERWRDGNKLVPIKWIN